ncbi:MAG: superoxide dismutase [Bacteroidetes bacterium]|nr:superoxide dismutase [Bacteroidota bacterium]
MSYYFSVFSIFLALSWTHFAQPFVLPKLPYAYADYAPYIDAQTMEIHLTKHHQAYVNNLNKSIEGTAYESWGIEEILLSVTSSQNDFLRNNAGGHYNHSLFWEILAPKTRQGVICDELLKEINTAFGNMDSLRKELNKAAMSRFGSGWAWLMVTPKMNLAVVSTANQDNPIMPVVENPGIPILGIDVWEHAYYLNYQNRRADYLKAVWDLIDWKVVGEKYQLARANRALLDRLVSRQKRKKKS